MNLKVPLLNRFPRLKLPRHGALNASAALCAWLLCICYMPLGCMAQQQQSAPAAASGASEANVLQPQRLFPREALSLPAPNASIRPLGEAQPVTRQVIDGGSASTFAPANSGVATAAAGAPGAVSDTGGGVTDLSYTLAENDRIKVNVFREPDLSIDARIGKDGTISVPYIGTVRVAGKSVREATRQITQLLDDGYLVNPQVSLTLIEYSKRQFTILGHVRNPGAYTMPDDQLLTLQQAVGLAGGFAPGAKRGKIVVTRMIGGENIIYRVDGTAFMRDKNAKPFIILPDDTIVVEETFW